MSRVMAVSPVTLERPWGSISHVRIHQDHGYWSRLLEQEDARVLKTQHPTPNSWKTLNHWVLLEYEILEGWLSG